MKTNWTISDIEVDVEYNFEPANPGSRDEPPSGGYVTVYAILIGDTNIYDIVSSSLITKLEEELYEYELEPPEYDD